MLRTLYTQLTELFPPSMCMVCVLVLLLLMRASYIRWFHFTCPFSHQDTFIERDSVDLRWLEPERQICISKWGERTRATERIGESKRKRRKCVSFQQRKKNNNQPTNEWTKKPFDHGVILYRMWKRQAIFTR